jgi:transcription initiation factor TFIIH subunit 2
MSLEDAVARQLRGESYDLDNADAAEHSWVQPLVRTWEQFDDESSDEDDPIARELKQERVIKASLQHNTGKVIEKGMIRFLYVIIDCSEAMRANDMRPNRRTVVMQEMEQFVRHYFDQNPISQLGFIITYNKIAEKITELSGSPKQQIANLNSHARVAQEGGECSLQNALEIAYKTLSQIPSYGSREILVVMGALGTCDPGDIHDTIRRMQRHHIRCSVVGLAAEVYICTILTKMTQGEYGVAMNQQHLRTLLSRSIAPPPVARDTGGAEKSNLGKRKWIRMGFPTKRNDATPSICACHKELRYDGFVCPKCKSKFCELPTDCRICGLTLVSSPHLARSYHHLFPLPDYTAVTDRTGDRRGCCFGCKTQLDSATNVTVVCPRCQQLFCVHCDQFVHESLHNCPGCSSASSASSSKSSSCSSSSGGDVAGGSCSNSSLCNCTVCSEVATTTSSTTTSVEATATAAASKPEVNWWQHYL